MIRYMMCALILSAGVGAAAAEQRPGDIYATGGVAFPYQAALDPGSAPPFPAPGGITVGWLVGGGVFLASQLSLEFDLSRTGTMQGSHQGRHDTGEAATRRDWFLSLGLKKYFGRPSGFGVDPIAGIVLVGDEGTYERMIRSEISSRGYYPLDWVPGVMFGVDFRIRGGRLVFIPGLRFAFTGVPTGEDCLINRSGQPECSEDAQRWKFRHPRWTQRPSIALRVNF